MVFGNTGQRSGTGVAFTRNPSTGEPYLYGEFLLNAQGEDVVAGIRTPSRIDDLKTLLPDVYAELGRSRPHTGAPLPRHAGHRVYHRGRPLVSFANATAGQRTAQAAVRIAVDMVEEGLIDRSTALQRVTPEHVVQLLHKQIAPGAKTDIVARGLPASPGAATGRIVFSAIDAEKWTKGGSPVILVRRETSPDDIGGMHAAVGILTSRGGMTSHAAVVARGMGKCCIVGAADVVVDDAQRRMTVKGRVFNEGDWLTLNGGTGEVMAGQVELVDAQPTSEFERLMAWADDDAGFGRASQCGHTRRCRAGPSVWCRRNRAVPHRTYVF